VTLRTAEQFGDSLHVPHFGGGIRRRENSGHNGNSVKVSFVGEHHARPTPGVNHIQEQANEGATKTARSEHHRPPKDFLAQRKRNVARANRRLQRPFSA
jgi:hypothetical protein